ncbi:MAG: tetratricopeptide repeat protein [Planctomycetes bacterium]|nr:tetratricopeptide repeat protein [Planctomycetota bacterium]
MRRRLARLVFRHFLAACATAAALGLVLGGALSCTDADPLTPAPPAAGAPMSEALDPAAPVPEGPAAGAAGTPLARADGLKQEALGAVRQALADYPDDPSLGVLLGSAHLAAGNSVEANACWQEAVRRHPNLASAYDAMAAVATAEGNLADAAALWRQAVAADPARADMRERLARVLIDVGRPAEAVTALADAPPSAAPSAEGHFLLGQAYLALGDAEKARQACEAAIQADPRHARAHYGLATALARIGQVEKARLCRATFERMKADELRTVRGMTDDAATDLAALGRRVAQILAGVAGVYAGHGRSEKAEPLWQRAAAVDAIDTDSRLRLAMLYAQTGRLAAAEAAFRDVVRLAPERSWGYQGLAQICMATPARLAEARAHAEAAARLDPVAPNYALLGEVCRRAGDAAGARAAFGRAAELDPANADYRRKYESLKGRE